MSKRAPDSTLQQQIFLSHLEADTCGQRSHMPSPSADSKFVLSRINVKVSGFYSKIIGYCSIFLFSIDFAFILIFKNFCANHKTNFTECKSSFGLAQNVCDWHNMYSNFWFDTKSLDKHKTF